MLKSILACGKLYISESRNAASLQAIERAAKPYPNAVIINRFKDEAYNRVGYTLVASLDSDLIRAVVSMAEAAFKYVDIGNHSGTHPRLGVVDHISFQPLSECSLHQSAGHARIVAKEIGRRLQVPIFLYGAAHEEGRSLASIRRELGYFKPNAEGYQWANGLWPNLTIIKPDEGPSYINPSHGVVIIGATQWVDNYNVPIRSTDMKVVRRIARRVSGRGGGFESIQTMALNHGDNCIEVACNLLDPDKIKADQIQLEVERLAEEEGLVAEEGYFTDFSKDRIIESYFDRVG